MSTTYQSLLVGATRWHDGDGRITYSFQSRAANYYSTVDTDGDGIVDSYLVDGEELTVAFGDKIGLSKALKAQTQFALDAWNDVANVNLVAAGKGKTGDIAIGAAHFGDESLYGFVSDFPGTPGVLSPNGDLWLNLDNPRQADPLFGSDGMSTLVHELGHALGLHHPDEDPNNDAGDPINNNQWTVMSYIAHPGVDPADDKGAYPVTPMVLDILAIQELYGANLDTRTGGTRYLSGNDALFPLDSRGRFSSGIYGIFTIWDAGGTDTLDASNQRGAVTIDLTPGSYSSIGGLEENVGLAAAVSVGGKIVNYIENASGGRGADTIGGNDANNIVKGNAGDDIFLMNQAGKDRVDGGSGDDIAYWDANFTARDAFKGGSGRDTLLLDGDFSKGVSLRSDTLSSVEVLSFAKGHDYALAMADGNLASGALMRIDGSKLGSANSIVFDGSRETDGGFRITGGRGIDILLGGQGADTIEGGSGTDVLFGGGGADHLTGGKGRDMFTFTDIAQSSRGDADRILDFRRGDVIDLSEVDANTGRRGDQAFHLGGGGGHAGDIVARYDAGNDETVLNLYVNGGSSIDMRIILSGEIDIAKADFIF